MRVQIKPILGYCELAEFKVNGVKANWEDFGEQYDADPENAPSKYGCGNLQFSPYVEVEDEILDKYHITHEEYLKVGERLTEMLSFGCCNLCD